MVNRRWLVIAVLAAACVWPALNGRPAGAAVAPQPTGITISPAFQQVTIGNDTAQNTVSFFLVNNQDKPQAVSLSARDFGALNETGGLFFIGANPTQLQKRYGLADWLVLPQKNLTLQPKQSLKISAGIDNSPDMAPGGHYGALMVSLDNGGDAGNGKVTLHPVASALMFVTKTGGDTHKLSLSNVYIKHSLLRLPSDVTLRFHNDGNTHLVPRGSVSLYDAKKRLISKGIINQDSSIILPGTYRRFTINLQKAAFPRLPGRYSVVVDFRFDGVNQFRRYSTSFFAMPRLASVVEIIVLAAIAGGALWILARRFKMFHR